MADSRFLPASSRGAGGEGALRGLIRVPVPFARAAPSQLVTSQRPRLPTLGLQCDEGGGPHALVSKTRPLPAGRSPPARRPFARRLGSAEAQPLVGVSALACHPSGPEVLPLGLVHDQSRQSPSPAQAIIPGTAITSPRRSLPPARVAASNPPPVCSAFQLELYSLRWIQRFQVFLFLFACFFGGRNFKHF